MIKLIKNLLIKHNFWAQKKLGQNFLIDSTVLQKIVEAGELTKNDTIIEIGPGLGVLTHELCKNAGNVIAIERDINLIPILKETTAQFDNLKVLNEDALKFEISVLNYKVIANIPYYITSPLLNKFLRNEFRPKIIVFLTQREVAEKICKLKEHKNKHSVLSINVHIFGQPEIIDIVPSNSFYPEPKVKSAILKITVYEKPLISKDTEEKIDKFFAFIVRVFKNPRKKLNNCLAAAGISKEKVLELINTTKIDPNLRPENLEISDFENLFRILENPIVSQHYSYLSS